MIKNVTVKILIDTNILIHLEDNKVIDEQFSKFYRLAISNDCKVYYHPDAMPKDLARDKNHERKEIILSKLEKYEPLEDYSEPTESFLSQIKNSKINDQIDNCQLFQLYKQYVEFFITEDKGIHSKSSKFDLNERVMDIDQALKFLEDQFIIKIPSHPILKEHSVRDIEDVFNSSFFDSLREDYGENEFNSWTQKCVRENRKCYSLISDDALRAILIYNFESVDQHRLPSVFTEALKICTLKVDSTAFGIKLGELFLNKMFELCINKRIEWLYLTVYEKQHQLINLLENFGFQRIEFKNSQGLSEIIMLKSLNKERVNSRGNEMSIHPFYFDDPNVKKYVIPITPEFYGSLFKDGKLREPTLFDTAEDSVNEIHGNTIIKAYISGSKNKQLRNGDIVLFYSSKKNQVIEPLGIVESAQRIDNFEELWGIVKKKTVFSPEDLLGWFKEKGELHVITFRLITYLENSIRLKKIKKIESFKNKIQSITNLKESDYKKLKDEGHFDLRYIIDKTNLC